MNTLSKYKLNLSRFPLEIHMVHINTKYVNNPSAAYENKDGLAVIGIFGYIVNGTTNEAFDPIMDAANELAVDNEGKIEKTLRLKNILDQVKGSDYFSYQGSLTTPGCDEIVSWIVYDQPILITESQVQNIYEVLCFDMPVSLSRVDQNVNWGFI